MKFSREFYIPKSAVKISDKASSAIAYLRTYKGKNGEDRYSVTAFGGKRSKPDFSFWYPTLERAEAKIKGHFAGEQARIETKAKRKAEDKAAHNFEVGTVLTGSWGYDQTNPEAYQVVEIVGKRTVKIRKIGFIRMEANCGMSEYVVPDVDGFTSDTVLTKRVTRNRISMDHYGLTAWDGQKMYNSWYA